MDSQLFALLRCPRCTGELVDRGKQLECRACQLDFPLIGGIPNLMPDPSKAIAEWRREAQRLLELLERGVGLMDEQLKYPDLLPSTRRRVARTRAAHAENGERITALFREAGLPPDSRAKASDKEFSLMEYYDQILRDWAWDQDGQQENARALQLLEEAMAGDTHLGKVLVLGAGPCRLAHDLHRRFSPTLTVALDINPLLLLAGKRVIFDGGMKLYEFPPDPRGIEFACVDHELRAPGPPPANFFPVLADAFSAPLQAGQFDTVLTPWFIDIVPVDLRETLGLIHGLLAPGGRWLNYGPLSYQAERLHSHRYSHEEVYQLIQLAAFDLSPPKVSVIDYMQSRAAARGKVVDVISFAARKRPVSEVPTDPISEGGGGADGGGKAPPPWMVLPHLPVPRFPGLAGYKPDHPMLVYLVGLIDGQRSLTQMARKMIEEHGARPDAALAGTRAMMAIVLEAVKGAPGS